MSHNKIKKIEIENGRVFITSAESNVYPLTYYREKCKSLTKLFNEKGKEALEIEILKEYENGNFQAGSENKYTNLLLKLKNTPEYEKFNWRLSQYTNECPIQKNRQSEKFYELLKKVIYSKETSKCRSMISAGKEHQTIYFVRFAGQTAKFSFYKTDGKVFTDKYKLQDTFDRLEKFVENIKILDLIEKSETIDPIVQSLFKPGGTLAGNPTPKQLNLF